MNVSDGWVHFVLGPFDANHNAATILENYFNRYEDKMNTIQEIKWRRHFGWSRFSRCYKISYS